ncbi:MAG TPA: hypothetical protein VGL40_08955 [Bacillota bacterium]|jgi:MFS-type transporter involved in bile tolerance (Atg22 family)
MSLPRQPSPDEQVRHWWKAYIAVPALPSITKQFGVSFGVASMVVTVVPGFALLGVALGFMALTTFIRVPFSTFLVTMVLVYKAQGLTSGSMQTLGSDIAPPHARDLFFGIWRLVSQTGKFLSPTVFAWLSAVSGDLAAFAFLSVTAGPAAGLLGFQVKETLTPKGGGLQSSSPNRAPASTAN